MEWRPFHLISKHPPTVQMEQSPSGALDALTQDFISHCQSASNYFTCMTKVSFSSLWIKYAAGLFRPPLCKNHLLLSDLSGSNYCSCPVWGMAGVPSNGCKLPRPTFTQKFFHKFVLFISHYKTSIWTLVSAQIWYVHTLCFTIWRGDKFNFGYINSEIVIINGHN